MVECDHAACDDEGHPVLMENSEEFYLCDDHAMMNPDGTPVDGYEPDDPSKFTAVTR